MKIQKLLTPNEADRLSELEKVIRRGERTFVEVGAALAEVRDSRLYRTDHKTFEEYCRDKWGWNSSRARQIIDAANVANEVKTVTNVTLSNEGQARALSKVEPSQRAEVLERAAASGKVTAKSIAIASEPTPPTTHEEEPPRIKTYDQEFKAAIGLKNIPADIAAHMESVIEDWNYIKSDPQPDEIREAALNFQVAAKMFSRWAKEIQAA